MTTTRTDPTTGITYRLELSIESGELCLPAPHRDHTHTTIGIERAWNDKTDEAIDPEDLPQSVHEWAWALDPSDL